MSWTLGAQTITPNGIENVAALVDAMPETWQTGDGHNESGESIQLAKAAIKMLLCSGAVGDPATYSFYVSASGHSNAGYAPKSGWSNDQVTISVSQAPAPLVAA